MVSSSLIEKEGEAASSMGDKTRLLFLLLTGAMHNQISQVI